MSDRTYTLKKRAKSQEETRQRIVEATMQLHEEVGPRNTTISAVAERAGVQRLTVYRHFPDETALFQACTSHWLTLNAPPDPSAWAEIEDAAERCIVALTTLYAYFRATQAMWRVAYRDVDQVEALQGPMAEFGAYLALIADGLADAFKVRDARQRNIEATLHHAVQFASWASMERQGLGDAAAASLVAAWLRGVQEE